MKRIISIFLSLVCIITALPLAVNAEDTESFIVSEEGVLPFEDVKESYWYADAAEFCYVNGIIKGMDAYTFDPNGKLTRAQFVFMLAQAEGVDLSGYITTRFNDVKPEYWYAGAVAWAYRQGIVSGTSETKFSPTMTVTREQLARMMWLYMKDRYPAEAKADLLGFKDADSISSWALEGMEYAVAQGLISGVSADTLQPRGTVTRAQMARILMLCLRDWVYGSRCDHSSVTEASCTERPVCSCGLTLGLALGHICETLTCTEGSECKRCGEVLESSPNLHTFTPMTCTTPITCIHCGLTRGTAPGHDFTKRTCLAPKTCKRCGLTEGTKSDHNVGTEGGKCSYCGEYIFYDYNPSAKARFFIAERGTKVENGPGSYIQYVEMPADDEIRITTLTAYNGMFRMETNIMYADGTVINCYKSSIRFDWRDNQDNVIQSITFADGYYYHNFVPVTPSKYTYDTNLAVSLYYDFNHSISYRQETAYRGVTRYMITVCNLMLKNLYEGGSVRDIGFISFY